jgi:hypothetical protein
MGASFARSGLFAMMRAINTDNQLGRHVRRQRLCIDVQTGRVEEKALVEHLVARENYTENSLAHPLDRREQRNLLESG